MARPRRRSDLKPEQLRHPPLRSPEIPQEPPRGTARMTHLGARSGVSDVACHEREGPEHIERSHRFTLWNRAPDHESRGWPVAVGRHDPALRSDHPPRTLTVLDADRSRRSSTDKARLPLPAVSWFERIRCSRRISARGLALRTHEGQRREPRARAAWHPTNPTRPDESGPDRRVNQRLLQWAIGVKGTSHPPSETPLVELRAPRRGGWRRAPPPAGFRNAAASAPDG